MSEFCRVRDSAPRALLAQVECITVIVLVILAFNIQKGALSGAGVLAVSAWRTSIISKNTACIGQPEQEDNEEAA